MKKIIKKIFLIISAISFNTYNIAYADAGQIYNLASGDTNGLYGTVSYIVGWLFYGILIAAVIAIMIKGIKFIVAAPDGKAEIKKELIPWAIGIVILLAFRTLISIVVNWVSGSGINNINVS